MSVSALYSILAPFAITLDVICIVFALVNKRGHRFDSLLIFLVVNALIIIFTALELSATSADQLLAFSRITYSLIAVLPILWLVFCVEYAFGLTKWFTPLIYCAIAVIPALTVVVAWTNPQHHLLWRNNQIVLKSGRLINLVLEYGQWFWVHAAYSYALYLAGIVALVTNFAFQERNSRRQSILMIGAAALPLCCNLLYIFRLVPGIDRDFSSLVYSISGLSFLVCISRYRLFEARLLEYRHIVEQLDQAMIICDERGAVLDINESACATLGCKATYRGSLERLLRVRLSELGELASRAEPMAISTSGGSGQPETVLQARVYSVQLNKSGALGYSILVQENSAENRLASMSRREYEVYELLARGLATKEIADQLCISENTAKTHIKHIYEKMRVTNRKELMRIGD